MDIVKEAEAELARLCETCDQGYSTTVNDIKTALEMTVMIELIKLLRAENENRQENGRTSKSN